MDVRSGRWVAVVVWGIVVMGAVQRAEAEPLVEEHPVRAVVAPTSFQLFPPVSEKDVDPGVGVASRRAVTRYLARHGETFEVVTPREVRESVRQASLYDDTLSIAQDWAELGLESYKKLDNDKAIEQLEKALERFDELGYQLVAPERVAELSMYLALSYLNKQSNAARPLEVMKRMIRLDPSRVLRPGYYPKRVANFYRTARQDLLRRLRDRGPAPERAEALAERTGAQLVLFGGTFHTDGGYRMQLRAYVVGEERFAGPVSATLETPSEQVLRRTANRLVSKLATCIYRPPSEGGSERTGGREGKSPWSTEFTATYGSFLSYPRSIEQPFGNAGVGVSVRRALTEEFGVDASFQFVRSFLDRSGRIDELFTTFRAMVGPDIGVAIGRLNIGLSVRVDVTRIGNFALCRSREPPDPDWPCSDRVEYEDLDYLGGVNVRPRIQFEVSERFELVGGGNFTTYLFPGARPLNNLLAGELGVRYLF